MFGMLLQITINVILARQPPTELNWKLMYRPPNPILGFRKVDDAKYQANILSFCWVWNSTGFAHLTFENLRWSILFTLDKTEAEVRAEATHAAQANSSIYIQIFSFSQMGISMSETRLSSRGTQWVGSHASEEGFSWHASEITLTANRDVNARTQRPN